MNNEKTKFKIFSVIFELNNILEIPSPEVCKTIIEISKDPKWWFSDGEFRYTLIKCEKWNDYVVYGFIAQEHTLDQHLYDDIKHSSDKKLESYEDRFFTLDLANFTIAVEWRRFRNKPPLTLHLTVERMGRILREACGVCAVAAKVNLEAIDYHTTREEFLDLFYSNRVLEIYVDEFGKFPVRDDVRLVNPSVHLEGAAREMIDHDVLHPSISKLVVEAKQDGRGNLRSSIIARAGMHSGQPLTLKYQDQAGDIHIRRRTEKGEIEVRFSVDSPDDLQETKKAVLEILQEMGKVDVKPDDRVKISPQRNLFEHRPDGEKDDRGY